MINLLFAVAIPYQLGFIYRRPTCPNHCCVLFSQQAVDFTSERFLFLIQALFTLEDSDLPGALCYGADAVCQ